MTINRHKLRNLHRHTVVQNTAKALHVTYFGGVVEHYGLFDIVGAPALVLLVLGILSFFESGGLD